MEHGIEPWRPRVNFGLATLFTCDCGWMLCNLLTASATLITSFYPRGRGGSRERGVQGGFVCCRSSPMHQLPIPFSLCTRRGLIKLEDNGHVGLEGKVHGIVAFSSPGRRGGLGGYCREVGTLTSQGPFDDDASFNGE